MNLAVDLHCHLLPGIDDGARDLNDAVAMARQAQEDGIEAICATPHIRHDHDVRFGVLAGRREELQRAVRAAGGSTRVLGGGEVAATALDGLSGAELTAVSLGGAGRWVLLEPAPGPLDERLAEAVARLGELGFRAVIAHPERHAAPDLIPRLAQLVGAGALVQATAAFFTDERSAAAMLELARAGVVHLLASDAHSSRAGRPAKAADALDRLAGVAPCDEHLDWIARVAPLAIVHGAELEAPFQAVAG